MFKHKKRPTVESIVTATTLAALTYFLLTSVAIANEQRFTIKSPGGTTPVDNWAFGLSIRNNPTGGGSVTTAVPAGSSDADVASAAAADITAQTGIKATASGSTLIISQHDQDPGFFFNPLAPGTKFGTSFGGLSGAGGTIGPWGVSRAFRVWAPAPPPIPILPPQFVQPQRLFELLLPPDPLGLPGIFNDIQINLLDDHDELLFSQNILIEDNANQQQLNFALQEAFGQFPDGLGGWMVLPQQEGFFFGNSLNEWMTGGGIEVLMQPGSEQSQMQLILDGEELPTPFETYADFNLDGVVDGTDMAIWGEFYGTAASFGDGDATFDNFVNGSDYLEIQRQFGPVQLPDLAVAQSVPEPNTIVLALGGILAMLYRRW